MHIEGRTLPARITANWKILAVIGKETPLMTHPIGEQVIIAMFQLDEAIIDCINASDEKG